MCETVEKIFYLFKNSSKFSILLSVFSKLQEIYKDHIGYISKTLNVIYLFMTGKYLDSAKDCIVIHSVKMVGALNIISFN